jgi:acetyltransferase-like isoleucine patch superfamily enzyme
LLVLRVATQDDDIFGVRAGLKSFDPGAGRGPNLVERIVLALVHARHGIEGVNRSLLNRDDPAAVLRSFGASIAPSAHVGARPRLHAAGTGYDHLLVGAGARIGDDCFLDLTDVIEIREGAVLGPLCAVITHHTVGRSPLAAAFPSTHRRVVLEEGCEVGAGCVVTQGVVIGAGSRVLPGTVVHRDVPPGAVLGGSPPRIGAAPGPVPPTGSGQERPARSR